MNTETEKVVQHGLKEQRTRPGSPFADPKRRAELDSELNDSKIRKARDLFDDGKISLEEFQRIVETK